MPVNMKVLKNKNIFSVFIFRGLPIFNFSPDI
jgi:hypothetical protein